MNKKPKRIPSLFEIISSLGLVALIGDGYYYNLTGNHLAEALFKQLHHIIITYGTDILIVCGFLIVTPLLAGLTLLTPLFFVHAIHYHRKGAFFVGSLFATIILIVDYSYALIAKNTIDAVNSQIATIDNITWFIYQWIWVEGLICLAFLIIAIPKLYRIYVKQNKAITRQTWKQDLKRLLTD